MDVHSLRDEFVRLSAVYSELRHAVVTGDERWWSIERSATNINLFGGPPPKIVNKYSLNDDRFTYVYCLWQGSPDPVRERYAEDEFHRLAEIAARLVPLKALPSRGGPVQIRNAVANDCALEAETEDCVKVGIPQVHIPTINKWVCHMIIANGVRRLPCEAHSHGTVGSFQSMVLPLDSFRASAIALSASENTANDDASDRDGVEKVDDREPGVPVIRSDANGATAATDLIWFEDIADFAGVIKKTVANRASSWKKQQPAIKDGCSYEVIKPFLIAAWLVFPADFAAMREILALKRSDSA